MIIKLTGTKKGQTAQLVRTRKVDSNGIKPGEYAYKKDDESPVTAFRKKLSNEISDFQLNRVNVRVGEYEGEATRTYSLRITYGDKSHIVDLGGGMTAQSVVNSLISLKNLPEEERHASDLSISFYNNKEGYCAASVRKKGELLEWFLKTEDKAQYIKTAQNPLKKDEVIKDFGELDKKFEELVGELNQLLPAGASSGANALDDEDDDSTANVHTAEQPSAQGDIPFDNASAGSDEV